MAKQLWRVEWMEGQGFPERTEQHRTSRKFERGADARRMVETIEAMPSHHKLIGVAVTDVAWTPVDWHTLPEPAPEPDDE